MTYPENIQIELGHIKDNVNKFFEEHKQMKTEIIIIKKKEKSRTLK
jgi:hypothetical protein